MTAVLRDYKQENVDAARALADELRPNECDCAVGDAFDRESLAAIEPRPTIGIVSGLYELFPANALVTRIARRSGRRDRARWPSDLHEPALASAGGIHRARFAQSRRQTVDHAPPHDRGDG